MTSTTAGTYDPPPSKPGQAAAARRPVTFMRRVRRLGSLLKETAIQWDEDQAARQAASLALYTLLSVAPLLIVSIKVAGIVLGDEAARGQISQEIGRLVGPQAGAAIEAMVNVAKEPGQGTVGTIIGLAVLLFGASGVFGELQTSLNQIWEVKPKPGRGVMGFLRDRFFSFTMVMGVAFLLLVSMVVSAALATVTEHFRSVIPYAPLWWVLNIAIGIGITTVLFGLIYKVIPDARINWHDVWVGAFATAVLFSVGRIALSWYVGRSATVSPFGAAGSLVALVVWVYYSAQILFFGAEFTQVFATRYGSRIVPSPNAVHLHDLPPEPKAREGRKERLDCSKEDCSDDATARVEG
ncbi:MAG TPA: YihY/virulence factor BrkB family protein [Polyangiaceae bacterium]|nr:YihY/virulence factor BrkB family protein [Polyangiaceae bacterium]